MTRFLATFLLCAFVLVAAVGMLNYVIDPLQYFRRYVLGPAVYSNEDRFQNPGLARHQEYDTAIIGTSMAENFSPAYIFKKTGWKALKLSMSGSTAFEQRKMVQVSLDSGRARRVIWVVQWDSFARPRDATRTDMGGLPEYLYEDKASARLVTRYLLNVATLVRSLRVLLGRGETNLERLHYWGDSFRYGCKEIEKALGAARTPAKMFAATRQEALPPLPEQTEDNLRYNLFEVVRSHPRVEFIIVIPPYSAWFFESIFANLELERSFFEFRDALQANLARTGNARVLDFQRVSSVVLNPKYYRDATHYSENINRMMVDWIGEGRSLPVATRSELKQMLSAVPPPCAGS